MAASRKHGQYPYSWNGGLPAAHCLGLIKPLPCARHAIFSRAPHAQLSVLALVHVAQVGRMLAELIQHELTDGLARRLVPQTAGPAPSWHSRFSRLALELIAVTTSAGGQDVAV